MPSLYCASLSTHDPVLVILYLLCACMLMYIHMCLWPYAGVCAKWIVVGCVVCLEHVPSQLFERPVSQLSDVSGYSANGHWTCCGGVGGTPGIGNTKPSPREMLATECGFAKAGPKMFENRNL